MAQNKEETHAVPARPDFIGVRIEGGNELHVRLDDIASWETVNSGEHLSISLRGSPLQVLVRDARAPALIRMLRMHQMGVGLIEEVKPIRSVPSRGDQSRLPAVERDREPR